MSYLQSEQNPYNQEPAINIYIVFFEDRESANVCQAD